MRCFFREFDVGRAPDEYYQYIAGRISKDELKSKYKNEWSAAENAVFNLSLGGDTNYKKLHSDFNRRLGRKAKWILMGGPPCQSYSCFTRHYRRNKIYRERDVKSFFYREFIKLIAKHQPPLFLMENVIGLLSVKINGELLFNDIFNGLKNPKDGLRYRLYSFSHCGEIRSPNDGEWFLLNAADYGIPQFRQRLFIFGVREDINLQPDILTGQRPPSFGEVCGGFDMLRGRISSGDNDKSFNRVLQSAKNSAWFASDKVQKTHIKKIILSSLDSVSKLNLKYKSGAYSPSVGVAKSWYNDERLTSISGHETTGVTPENLHRYLFAIAYYNQCGRSPGHHDFPKGMVLNYKCVRDNYKLIHFPIPYRVPDPAKICHTIIGRLDRMYIHTDPAQCRSLSLREGARIQTFPDNYHFEGGLTDQLQQLGNAVPPYLAYQIGRLVKDFFDRVKL